MISLSHTHKDIYSHNDNESQYETQKNEENGNDFDLGLLIISFQTCVENLIRRKKNAINFF